MLKQLAIPVPGAQPPSHNDMSKEEAEALRKLNSIPKDQCPPKALCQFMVLCLGSEFDSVKNQALAHLFPLTSQFSDQLVEAGAVSDLVHQLDQGTEWQQEQVACCLANLALNEGARKEIVDKDGIDPLLRCVNTGTALRQQEASCCLANLALHNDAVKEMIVKKGGVPLFLACFNDGTELKQEYVACLLANLALLNDAVKEKIGSKEGIRLLRTSLDTGTSDRQEYVACLLANLVSNKTVKKELSDQGGLDNLLRSSKTGTDTRQEEVMRCLANWAQGDYSVYEAWGDVGVINRLLDELNTGSDTRQEEVMRCLFYLIQTTGSNVDRLIVGGGVPLLLANFDTGTDLRQDYAVGCLEKVATRESTHASIINAGGIDRLAKQLNAGAGSRKEGALRCLLRLCSIPEYRVAIGRRAASDILSFVSNGTEDQRAVALDCLSKLSMEDTNRILIVDNGVIPVLFEVLRTGEPSEKRKVQECLDLLCENEGIAIMIRSVPGMENRGLVYNDDVVDTAEGMQDFYQDLRSYFSSGDLDLLSQLSNLLKEPSETPRKFWKAKTYKHHEGFFETCTTHAVEFITVLQDATPEVQYRCYQGLAKLAKISQRVRDAIAGIADRRIGVDIVQMVVQATTSNHRDVEHAFQLISRLLDSPLESQTGVRVVHAFLGKPDVVNAIKGRPGKYCKAVAHKLWLRNVPGF